MFNIPQDRPVYRIVNQHGFFGPDSHLYREGDIIAFKDEPNEEMEPLNELARKAMEKYLNKLDDLGKEVAKKNGRQFAGRPRTLDGIVDLAAQDARRVSLVKGDGGVPLMSAEMKDTGIEKIEPLDVPQTTVRPGKKNTGGTLSLSKVANEQTPLV